MAHESIKKLKELFAENGLMEKLGPGTHDLGFSKETMFDLFVSRTTTCALNSDSFVEGWIDEKLAKTELQTELIPVDKIDKWYIEKETGNIRHDSGRFFTITGVKVRHRTLNDEIEWDQPIIDQPEVGILGILVKKIDGVLHFCLQAKEEPGNINSVQLSPTVQATFSNYSQVHGGKLPPFVELFLDPPRGNLLFAKLQTEDGGRFLFKSNRNMLVMLDEEESGELPDAFIWLTLRQIGNLIKKDNLINSCARSVLSCLI